MRKTFGVALGAAMVGALALAAFSPGATHSTRVATSDFGDSSHARLAAGTTDTYKGRFKGASQNGSKIKIKAKVRGGEAVEIKSMSYVALMDCDTSGATVGRAGWRFTGGIPVKENRRFRASGDSVETPTSSFTLKGRFSRDFDKVKGTFRTRQWFDAEKDPPLPAEYCNLEPTRYVAKR
jgi:hypothetical protein